MDAIIQIVRKLGLIQRVIPIITAVALVFSLAAGFIPEPYDRGDVKNVIFIIGDGMGENHLKMVKQELGIELAMETMPLRGQAKTRSIGMVVTDSAAAATALACGVRTTNGAIGVYPYDMFAWEGYPVNLTELAIEKGMKTGIVTTDSTTGATPAGFSAHTSVRSNSADIANQQIGSDIDLIWGAANGDTLKANVEASGFTYISTLTELNALNAGTRSFGQFNGGDLWRPANSSNTPTLSQMTEKAIGLLDNDNGFFLMIEGAHFDKHSHGNNREGLLEFAPEFDKAVAAALDFAEQDGNTLVVVTADHETGAIQLKDGRYDFTSGSHSAANVPLLAYGSDDLFKNGAEIWNKDLSRFIALSMGFTADEFPHKMPIYWIMDDAA